MLVAMGCFYASDAAVPRIGNSSNVPSADWRFSVEPRSPPPSRRTLLGSKKDKAKDMGGKGKKKEIPNEVDPNPLPAPVQRAALVLMELENCG